MLEYDETVSDRKGKEEVVDAALRMLSSFFRFRVSTRTADR